MKYTKTINLDVNKPFYEVLHAKQNDNARYLLFNLLNNGVPFVLTDKTVRAYAIKPDGTKIYNDLTIINAINGQAELQLTSQMLAVPGMISVELVIFEGTDILSTVKFVIEVTGNLRNDDAIESTNEFSALLNAMASIDNLEVNYAPRLTIVESSLSDKANITDVETKIGDMVTTKIFKGSCLFSELPSTGMLVDDYWYVTDQDTNYCYNGIVWVDIGNNLKIGDNTITPVKTNFFTYGKNLIDKNNLIAGKFINYLTGLEEVDVRYSCTDFIEIIPSTSYVCNGGKQGAFYDVNRVYISGFPSGLSITTPLNAKYIRVSMFTSEISTEQLEKGTISTTYEAHKDLIKTENVPMSSIATYVSQNITKESITPANLTSDIITSINLFDKTASTINFYVQSVDGELFASDTYYSSDWILVKPNTNYVVSPLPCPQLAFYNVNKVYISGLNDSTSFTTPSNCVYMRMSVLKTMFDDFQVEIGYKPTQYKDFSYILNSDFIGTGTIDVTKLSVSPLNKIVTVKATGGDYTTISSAIANETGTPYKGVDIVIDSGTYIEELVLKDYINLIGVNRDTVILQSLPSTDNFYNRDVIKCSFNSVVKNLTINAHNVKYCVHADAIGDYTFNLENCVLDKTQIDAYGVAIGLGLRGNQHVKIKNCEIRGDDRGLYMHNLNDQVSNCSLEIENSKIIGTNASGIYASGINLESLGSNMSDLIILKGNKIRGGGSCDMLVSRRLDFGHNQDDLVIIASGNKVDTYARGLGCQIVFEQPIVVETVVTDI